MAKMLELVRKLMQVNEQDLDLRVLKTPLSEDGFTVAHAMAQLGYKFTDKDVLKIARKDGWTVAHEMARMGYEFTDKEILKLADKEGWTVAHEVAKSGGEFYSEEILKLADVRGWTVAHVMAERGRKFTDKDILKLVNRDGQTVAHIVATNGCYFNDKELLEQADDNCWTVLHESIYRELIDLGREFVEDSFLKATEERSWVVATRKLNELALKLRKARRDSRAENKSFKAQRQN